MSEPPEHHTKPAARFKLWGVPALITVATIVTIAATATGLLVTASAVAGNTATGTYADGSPAGANLGAVVASAQDVTADANSGRADLIGVTPGGDHVLVFNGGAIVCYNADLGGRVSTPVQDANDEWVVAPSGGLFYGVTGGGAGITLDSFTVNSDCSVKEGFKVSFAPKGFVNNFGISEDGSKLYVFDVNGGNIYEVDAKTGQVEQTVPGGTSTDDVFANIGPLLDQTEGSHINHSLVNSKGETLALDEQTIPGSLNPARNRFSILKDGNPVTTVILGTVDDTINSLWIGKDMHHLYAGSAGGTTHVKVLQIDASAPRVSMASISTLDALLGALAIALWVLALSEPRWRPRLLAARERSHQAAATAEEANRLQAEQRKKEAEVRQLAEVAEAKLLALARAETSSAGYPAGLVGGNAGAGAAGQFVQLVPQTNGLSVASIIVVWFIPFLGAILGHLALGQINRVSASGVAQSGRGLALASVIIGWVSTASGLIVAIVYIAAIASALR